MKETSFPFVIEAEEVDRLHSASGLTLEGFLATLVEPTRAFARAPISKFHVGAVGLGLSGRVFRGVNIEFPGLPLSCSVHAEQFLVANAARSGERRLKFLAVSATPCGHCRQFLQELRGASDLQVLIVESRVETYSLSHLLPHRFGPQDLLHADFPLLMEPQTNSLYLDPRWLEARVEVCSIESAQEAQVLNKSAHDTSTSLSSAARHDFEDQRTSGRDREIQELRQLRVAALEAANNSYAPYTRSPSGLAFLTSTGKLYMGSYYESAAYNPSLPPLQSALVAFVAEGGNKFDEIRSTVLVERDGAVISQADTASILLREFHQMLQSA